MSGATPKPESEKFSPRNFLRARRPERVSDSVASERQLLDRTTLEYHLDTLTNRSQETLFEEFARQLAQREVCPNLQPHTGPTGGGDSKVDSETYPVAEAISAGWYVGAGGTSGSERWAFAISAKKQWLPKARSDIASLVGTGRGYVKAFFVSNQYIRDKQRAAEEDALSTKHGIKVHIFDRSWILDRVFAGGHEKLAISALGISVPFLSEAAADILTQLMRDVGNKDPENRLRIAIVRNISRKHPSHYRVVIGSNLDPDAFKTFASLMFRVHTMTPTSSDNLERFLAAYDKSGSYLVGIGVIDRRNPRVPEPMRHGYVLKKTLQVREAWTIGVNDIDGAGVLSEDDVPIPPGRENNAPVLELLQRKSERSHRAEWPSLTTKSTSVPRKRRKIDSRSKHRDAEHLWTRLRAVISGPCRGYDARASIVTPCMAIYEIAS